MTPGLRPGVFAFMRRGILAFSVDFPRAYDGPLAEGDFRSKDEDFVVDESLGFEPEGEGEHQYIQLVKRGENTQWVAKHIARFAGVKEMDVGYCGLKDRRAVTSQWFSVYLPKREMLDWSQLQASNELNVHVLQSVKGQKKLRRGQHAHNRFAITLRNVVVAEPQRLDDLLNTIADKGVPNYFGEQRFGRDANNLVAASRWLDDGERIQKCGPKHMLMSAARSYLFNLVLAQRVRRDCWWQALEGDALDSDGNPTGPLWGRGRSATGAEAKTLEDEMLAPLAKWADGLEHCGLQQERRPFVLKPRNLCWQYEAGERRLVLEFDLPAGQYATSVLREISHLKTPETIEAPVVDAS